MNKKSKSAYGPSFFIRMGVLVLLLLIVGGGLAYDRLVLVPGGKDAVDRVIKACSDSTADRAAVYKAAGCDPTATQTSGRYEIEDWNFGRILPNLEGYRVTVIFDGDQVVETYRGGMPDEDRETFK